MRGLTANAHSGRLACGVVATLVLLQASGGAEAKARLTPAQVRERNASLVAGIARQAGEPPWTWIVIHHTAAERDSLQSISHYHAKRFADPLGIEYHFLIGNGHSAGDGEIQLGRWQHRAPSIHVAHPERAPTAITVTAQGNLHVRAPSTGQMLAFEELLRRLMKLYAIPPQRLSSNTRVDGTITVCPGRYFPFDRLIWRLRQPNAPTAADWRDPLEPAPLEGPLPDLEALRAGLAWDGSCATPIPVSAWQPLGKLQGAVEGVEARLLGIEGGRRCTPIQRRYLVIRNAAGWYWRELNGYRHATLRAQRGKSSRDEGRFRFDSRDERGVMQRCTVVRDAPPSCRLPRPGER